MARLLRPVTKIISVMPAAAASSTAYWMSGLSTTGSISFGLALVTGRKRLPRPATGNTAFLSLACIALQILQHFPEFFFAKDANPECAGPLELRARVLARDDEIGLLRHRAGDFVPLGLDRRARLVARHPRERPGQHEVLHRTARARRGRHFGPTDACADQVSDDPPVVRLVEKLPDRARHHGPDIGHLQELVLARALERLQ